MPADDRSATPRGRDAGRLLDAAGNRAREGVRVLEDIARFMLDDADLAAGLKGVRHEISALIGSLPIRGLGESRDTPGDVGTTIRGAMEARRPSARALVIANARRATEGVRTLEEGAKLVGADSAGFEGLRYRLYELERRLLARLGASWEQWSVCVLLTESLCRLPWEEVVRRSIAAGAECIQLREKSMDDGELLGRARALVALVRAESPLARVIINDRPDIALASGADGVHLGQTDQPVEAARRVVGQTACVGVSCSTMEQARAAVLAGASYCGLGPMFPSTTKTKPALSGPTLVRAFLDDAATRDTPHLAISGITPGNVGELVEAGVRGVAVSSAVCASERPDEVCAALREALAARGARATTLRP